MTRHDDNLARLATARAKLAETTPGEWVADGGFLTAPVDDAYRARFPHSQLTHDDIFEGDGPMVWTTQADAEHIAAIHNAWGLVLDWCQDVLARHSPIMGGGYCNYCTDDELPSHWPCPEYLNAEAVLKAVTP